MAVVTFPVEPDFTEKAARRRDLYLTALLAMPRMAADQTVEGYAGRQAAVTEIIRQLGPYVAGLTAIEKGLTVGSGVEIDGCRVEMFSEQVISKTNDNAVCVEFFIGIVGERIVVFGDKITSLDGARLYPAVADPDLSCVAPTQRWLRIKVSVHQIDGGPRAVYLSSSSPGLFVVGINERA